MLESESGFWSGVGRLLFTTALDAVGLTDYVGSFTGTKTANRIEQS